MAPVTRALWGASCVLLTACTGSIGGGGGDGKDGPSEETLSEIGESGLRRLTAAEFDRTVYDLLGVVVTSETSLPEDPRNPFDNDFTGQQASEALITAADQLAGNIAAQVSGDPALREAIVPCTPAGADDEACYQSFVESFGRLALRRPLTEEEVGGFMTFVSHAAQADDFWVAVDSALRAFLQHPYFLYRVEIGTPVDGQPGVFRLTDYELATRLSYTVSGSTPPGWLLDLARDGGLSDGSGVRDAVEQMMQQDDAKSRVARFHSLWMGYERLPHAASLAASMQLETGALIEKVLFEDRGPWVDLLRSDETYLNSELATHYGLPEPAGGEGWVSYGDSGRQGLLSQGSFLSAAAKFDDTSPTQRGLLIRTRLFCQTINKPPPDLNVNVDMPPEAADPDACKPERYTMWKTDGCSTCHHLMDPVGFGLENYDMAGRYREFEPDRPDCPIDGVGQMDGASFQGPAELAEMMIDAGGVDACVATMFYRFAMGRYHLASWDDTMLERLVPAAQGVTSVDESEEPSEPQELEFYALVMELLSSEAFRHRREEVVQ